jgi:hypothetical protein
MAATSEPAEIAPGAVSFELDRFERSDGRLELGGRWYGVRGVRFIRPTLRLRSPVGSSRALADLEHKPWMPADGEPWEAAFPCNEDLKVLDAELAVTSGIVIPLPAPDGDRGDAGPIPALPRREPARAKPGSTRGATTEPRKPSKGAPPTTGDQSPKAGKRGRRESLDVAKELAVLREETERLRAEPVRLQGELDQSEQLRQHAEGELERLKLDADGAVARRDAAVGRYEDVASEREAAVHARDEALAERDQARARLRAGVAERDRAVAERDAATSSREQAISERDRAIAEHDRAIAERDLAIAERDGAISERDRAIAEREEAIAERDQARAQRVATVSPRSAPPPAHRLPIPVALSDDQTRLMQRAIAIAVLLAAGLALLIVLGVL